MDQEVISTFKSYSWRNTFCETIAAVDGESSNGSGQSILKTFWEGFSILDVIKSIGDSRETININRSLEEVDSHSHEWLWSFQDSVK